MCLSMYSNGRHGCRRWRTDSSLMQEFAASKTGTVSCWKVYLKRDNGLASSVYSGPPITGSGVVKSDRPSRDVTPGEMDSWNVGHGIHVYVQPPGFGDGCVRVRVECRRKDLVAVGRWGQAVFMQVRIPKREWTRIFGEAE